MKKLALLALLLISFQANAAVWVEIDDASKLLWQMRVDGTVYFRNIDEFDSTQAGCCYAYYLDTTTPGGKIVWSTILTKIAGHKRISLSFTQIGSNANPQNLSAIGRHSHASNE